MCSGIWNSVISNSQQKKHEITTPFQNEKKKKRPGECMALKYEGPYLRGGMMGTKNTSF